jgi:ABC-type polysaccharide/polyol phosphate transport system ATPase subunit
MGLNPKEIDNLVEDICAFADLGEYISLPIRTYSSGMWMRLAFAISTSIPADIILMDEWLSAGDAAFSTKASERINGLVDKANILVIASHNPDLIRKSCNRIFRLEHGKIVSEVAGDYFPRSKYSEDGKIYRTETDLIDSNVSAIDDSKKIKSNKSLFNCFSKISFGVDKKNLPTFTWAGFK